MVVSQKLDLQLQDVHVLRWYYFRKKYQTNLGPDVSVFLTFLGLVVYTALGLI